ncbi:MAG: VWA domain-containing protein [Hyphomicrobium sp.]|uniref:vWA domain-containing protein n=1 Tax=Hyphomicrobium sp. TaxID=82 RepID=UPI003D131511
MPLPRRPGPIFLAVLCLLAVAPPSAAADDTEARAVIVLDGSGSMWGNVPGERPAKFDLARAALRQSLTSVSPRVPLALMSFGQRRRADCSDVEVLAPLEAGPPERILSIADKLNPKGKGPLSLALREAAMQIPEGEAGSVIAIHDGVDNCGQDTCQAAADIAKANPKTRVFLIGFGLEPGVAQSLACVAAATNGRVSEAHTSHELADTISETLTLANLERVDPTTGVAVPVPKAATPPPPVGEPGLRLSASLTPDSNPVAAPVRWTVAKAEAPATIVKSAFAKDLVADLDPGSYVVEARLGQASVKQTIEVGTEGPTAAKIALGAGVLNLKARADRAGTALSDPLVTVSAKDGDADKPVWVGRDASAQLVLPEGTYVVSVEDGLAVQSSEVSVKAGAGSEAAPVLGTGRLELSAVSANGEPLADVVYTIEEDDPDSPQGRREVARSADPAAAFTLEAGTYYVAARSGAAEAHDRIALGSGATVKHAVTLNLVSITIITSTTSPGEDATSPAQPIVIRILSEDGQAREIARAHSAKGSFQLPPARYRVEATVMGLNVKALGVIDLVSNNRGGNVQLKLEQGEVSVEASRSAARHWRIKDAEGRTVMHSGRMGGGSVRLAPGRYVLLADAGDKRIEQVFDLKAGEKRQLTVESP